MNIVELEKSYRRLHYRWARLANHAHAVRQQLREVDEKIREIKGVYQSTLRETERTLAGALHKQGFTITQIADQLRLSRGQAASRLRQWKRRSDPQG
jgi:DNA-binding NtrC family response regulator